MFRLKIALFSVILSGTVLIGFGLYTLSITKKIGLDRIDREILSLGEGHLAAGPPREYWQNFGSSLKVIYPDKRAENVIVQIKGLDREILYKSSNWAPEITEESFPEFDREMDTVPQIPNNSEGANRTADPRSQPAPAGQEQLRPEMRDDRQEHRGPPSQAFRACEGKTAGAVSQFVNPRGETIEGTCENFDGRLVLRPYRLMGGRPGHIGDGPGNRPDGPPFGMVPPKRPMPHMKKAHFATIDTASGTWRAGIMGTERVTMMIGVNMASYLEDVDRYRLAFLGIIPAALLLLAGGGWILAQRALKPVSLITRTAVKITARDLNQRIPAVDADRELSKLVEVINSMLDRLEKGFGQAVRFSADAAHELQTPLTILQGELDDALQHSKTGSEEQLRYSGLIEEVLRLKSIVQKLLVLARADAGRLELHLEEIDFSAMIVAASEDIATIAPDLKIEKEITPGIIVKADNELMGQVINNLTSNALKYNHENGVIRFILSGNKNKAVFTIMNTGKTIPLGDRGRIFNRFYRVDESRNKAVSGSGLGLSLAREIMRAHKGDIRLEADSGNMVSFTLSLPLGTG